MNQKLFFNFFPNFSIPSDTFQVVQIHIGETQILRSGANFLEPGRIPEFHHFWLVLCSHIRKILSKLETHPKKEGK